MSDHQILFLTHAQTPVHAAIRLPASKSESNRALIINALSGQRAILHNISEARDTQTMQRLLASQEHLLDVIDAGTTMRFLTAYVAVTRQNKILTGTPRMRERPIALLVNALRQLGAQIEYLEKEGFPPIHIQGMKPGSTNRISIRGDVSSQYISALLMIAPYLPEGLELELIGAVGSRPYIQMTLDQMQHFGVRTDWKDNTITVLPQTYKPAEYTIESDWSGASYWYSMVALAPAAEVTLLGLREHSLQGDRRIVEIMQSLGVASEFTAEGVRLTKSLHSAVVQVDFTDCPDLAQTVAVCCAAKGIHLTMTGVESLKIKETDRIKGLQQELAKFGAHVRETSPQVYEVSVATFTHGQPVQVETYDDHRMAMAFAPLALLTEIQILNPDVVVKSYPGFWEDLRQTGFAISIAQA